MNANKILGLTLLFIPLLIAILDRIQTIRRQRDCTWCSYLVEMKMSSGTGAPCYICGTRSPGRGNRWLRRPKT